MPARKSAPARQSAEMRRAHLALAAMFLTNGFLMGAWAPQIPLLLPRHDISEGELGFLILTLGIGAVTAMLFAGRLIAAFGSVRVCLAFAVLVLPVLPLVVHASSLWTLAPAMALFGATAGSMDVAMNANAVEVERRLGRAIMSSSHGFWSLGGFIGGTSGAWVIKHASAEQQSLLAMAICTLLVLLAAPFLRGAPAETKATTADAPHKKGLPREPGIWLLGAMALFCMMPEGAVLDWAALYLGREMQADPFVAGLAFAFFAGAMAIMRFAGDALRNRLGAVTTLRLSGLLGAGGMLLATVSPWAPLAILGFALSGLGVANMVPILFSAAGNYPGHAAGSAISVVTMVGYAGILIAPASIGWLAEHIGFRPTYGGLALLLALVALLAERCAMADARHGPDGVERS